MPTNKEIEVILTLKDEASKKVQSFRSNVKEFSKETKNSLAPILQLRRAWMYGGIAIGATIGTIIKGIQEVEKLRIEINALDVSAIKLGVSTEALSKRMYGFNIATLNARLGTAEAHAVVKNTAGFWKGLTTTGANMWGSLAKYWRAYNLYLDSEEEAGVNPNVKQLSWKESLKLSEKQKKSEEQKRLESSKEVIAIEEGLTDKIKQLNLSTYEYKKQLLQQEVDIFRVRGVTEERIAAYQAAQQKILLQSQYGFARWSDFVDDSFRQYIGSWKTMFSSFFEDAFNGELKKGTDYFLAFGRNLNKIFANAISEMIMRWALFGEGIGGSGIGQWVGLAGKVAGLFGGFSGTITGGVGGTNTGMQTAAGINGGNPFPTWSPYHTGGLVRPVYAHRGLAPDEIPIIARRNEGVLTEEGVAAVGGSNGIRALNSGRGRGGGDVHVHFHLDTLDQKTGAEFLAKNAKMIGSVVASEYQKNNVALCGASKQYG